MLLELALPLIIFAECLPPIPVVRLGSSRSSICSAVTLIALRGRAQSSRKRFKRGPQQLIFGLIHSPPGGLTHVTTEVLLVSFMSSSGIPNTYLFYVTSP